MHTILDLDPKKKKMLLCFRHDFVVMLSHVYSDMAVQLSDLVICTTASRNVVYIPSSKLYKTLQYRILIS